MDFDQEKLAMDAEQVALNVASQDEAGTQSNEQESGALPFQRTPISLAITILPLYQLCQDIPYRKIEDIEQVLFTKDILGERYPLLDRHNDEDLTSGLEEEENDSQGDRTIDNKNTNIRRVCCFEERFLSDKFRLHGLPEEIFLELMLVVVCQDVNTAFSGEYLDKNGRELFLRPRQIKLRRLIFNNPLLDYYNSRIDLSDSEKWLKWSEKFIESNLRIVTSKTKESKVLDPDSNPNNHIVDEVSKATQKQRNDIAYQRIFTPEDIKRLQQAFGDFNSFVKAIRVLRTWAFTHEDRQWGFNFLYPLGPDCLYTEVDNTHKIHGNYMSGAGLLVYSMLQRSHDQEKLAVIYRGLCDNFLDQNNLFNLVAKALQGRDPQLWFDQFKQDVQSNSVVSDYDKDQNKVLLDSPYKSKTSYLPYLENRVFQQITDDFHTLISLGLDHKTLFQSLSLISVLNLLIYYLETCQKLNKICGIESNIDIVIECSHEKGNNLRNLASERCKANNALLREVMINMLKFYMACIFPSLNSSSLLTSTQFRCVVEVLQSAFKVKDQGFLDKCDFENCLDANYTTQELSDTNQALSGAMTQLASYDLLQKHCIDYLLDINVKFLGFHRNYCAHIGLASATKARSYRYVLSDELLHNLVLANVNPNKQQVLLDDFLAQLYTKYHIVIGPIEGRKYYDTTRSLAKTIEESLFDKNLEAFKSKLDGLGFLVKLGDRDSYIKITPD